MTLEKLKELVGDKTSLYYGILREVVDKYLRGAVTSCRTIILYGAISSGKSSIANFLGKIFLSYGIRQQSGLFDNSITREETNVQLLILDEANVVKLCKKDNLPDTKQLLEGNGRNMNIKFA